jgi:putative ABC transport system permease protein
MSGTVFKDSNYASEALAGESCIWTGLGFAVLSPILIRFGQRVLGPFLRPFTGASGYLANLNLRQRSRDTAGVLTPVVLFIGLSGGSLGLQQVQNHALAANQKVQSASDKGVETINFVVVGMLAVFAAVVLINIAVSTTLNRRQEFGLQRVVGATSAQVMRMVYAETFVVVVTGLVFGFIAAMIGNVGYSIGQEETALPNVSPGLIIGVLAAAVVITFLASIGAARRALQPSALEALTVQAS